MDEFVNLPKISNDKIHDNNSISSTNLPSISITKEEKDTGIEDFIIKWENGQYSQFSSRVFYQGRYI